MLYLLYRSVFNSSPKLTVMTSFLAWAIAGYFEVKRQVRSTTAGSVRKKDINKLSEAGSLEMFEGH